MEERHTKLSDYHKDKIIALLLSNGSMTKSQLADALGVSRPTIYHHINILKDKKIVAEGEPDKKKKGSPILISLNPETLKILAPIRKADTLKLLKSIKKQPINIKDSLNFKASEWNEILSFYLDGYTNYSISEKGEALLNKLSKQDETKKT